MITGHCNAAWLYDERACEKAWNDWGNYWALYTEELLRRLGAGPRAISREQLPEVLSSLASLVLPASFSSPLSSGELELLERWVQAGGVLVVLATLGAESLCGVTPVGSIEQSGGPFSPTCLLEYTPRVREELGLDRRFLSPIIAPGRQVTPNTDAQLMGVLRDLRSGAELGAGLVLRRIGRGWTCYWAFDLAQAAWTAHQGRPVYVDRDGLGYLRTTCSMLLGDADWDLPHIDLMLFVLREVLRLSGQVFVEALPPVEGRPADCLLCWGGDEEGAKGTAAWASNWMAGRGLPYHVNVMPDAQGTFACTPQEADDIRARGHEVSLHLNLMDGRKHPSGFTQEDIGQQVESFVRHFGFVPNTVVFHWVRWYGWTEPAQWLAELGVRGDNSKHNVPAFKLNPTNTLGYAFGTSFPYHAWTDWHSGNCRLDFVFQPITAYECGYDRETDTTDFAALHQALRQARQWGLTTELFYHSVNLTWYPSCRRAVEEVQRWLAEEGVRAVHMGNDRLTNWWAAREGVEVVAERRDGGMVVTTDCSWPDGCTLRLPGSWQARDMQAVRGKDGRWTFLAVGRGHTTVAITPHL